MDRHEMIEKLVDGLEEWMKEDKEGFWDHVRDLERTYLRGQPDKWLISACEDLE